MAAAKTRPTTWNNIPEVFDYKYAALIVGYCPAYLARLIRKGEFPGTKHGRKILCTKDAVRAWVEDERPVTQPTAPSPPPQAS